MREFFLKIREFLNLAVCSIIRVVKKSNCSAVTATFIEGKEILNLVSRYAQIPDKQNYLEEVGGIMKL